MDILTYTNRTFVATDLAGLLGARLNRTCLPETDCQKMIKDQKVSLWSTSGSYSYDLFAMEIKNPDASQAFVLNTSKNIGLAPILSHKILPKDLKQLLTEKKGRLKKGLTVSFGEYPMMIADKKTSEILTKIADFYPTGKEYTFNTIISPYCETSNKNDRLFAGMVNDKSCCWKNLPLDAQLLYENVPEVIYHGEKYVCVTARYVLDHPLPDFWKTKIDAHRASVGYDFLLSDGNRIEWNNPYWVKVDTVDWKTGYFDLYPTKVLLGGIPLGETYDFGSRYTDEFVNKYFFKEIIPSDAREVSKAQFKDELKNLIIQNDVQTIDEISYFIQQAVYPYQDVKTKEASFVLAYAHALLKSVQEGVFDKETFINKELQTPCLKKKVSHFSVFKNMFANALGFDRVRF